MRPIDGRWGIIKRDHSTPCKAFTQTRYMIESYERAPREKASALVRGKQRSTAWGSACFPDQQFPAAAFPLVRILSEDPHGLGLE
jgi:hypothetical protein